MFSIIHSFKVTPMEIDEVQRHYAPRFRGGPDSDEDPPDAYLSIEQMCGPDTFRERELDLDLGVEDESPACIL